MKGTARRGRTTREDREIAEWLHGDPKNRSENVMIVDLVRNDLGRVAQTGASSVEELFAVERYPTLWQMTSTVSAELRPEAGFYDIFRALFPCGSVTGAPKVRAMQLIAELEDAPRGVYTGAIGFFSPRQTVFNVAIRTLELDGARGTMGVGSGVVIDSDPAEEYRECLLKAEFLTGPAHPNQAQSARTCRSSASLTSSFSSKRCCGTAATRCLSCISIGSKIQPRILISRAIAPRSAQRSRIMRGNSPIESPREGASALLDDEGNMQITRRASHAPADPNASAACASPARAPIPPTRRFTTRQRTAPLYDAGV